MDRNDNIAYSRRAGAIAGFAHSLRRLLETHLAPRDLEALHRRLRPGFSVWRAFVEAASASIQFRRFDEADAVLSRALAAFPGDGTLTRVFASSAHARGDFESAITRWEAAIAVAPHDPFYHCALSANFRANHQIWQASAVMTEALRRFPGTLEVVTEAARTAMARRSFSEALTLWTVAASQKTALPEWSHGRIDALARLGRLDEAEATLGDARARFPNDAGLMALGEVLALTRRSEASRPPASEIAISPADLVSEFESLGDNCEFGLLQRFCGIEPLGLFRFSGSQARNLQHAFATHLEEYGDDADLDIFATSYDKEYVCRSRRYGDFEYHTEVYEGQGELAPLRAREIRKVAYLKQRIMMDLRSGEKIFVRKGGPYQAAVDLHRTMRQIGPNTLLWVQPADDDHPSGHVEIVEDGLLRGFISRFPPYDDAPSFELREWLTICANALALVRGAGGEAARYRLTENRIAQVDQVWQIEPKCVARPAEWPRFLGDTVYAMTLERDTERHDATVARRDLIATPPRALIAFSVWIFVPTGFRGTFIDVHFINSPTGFIQRADLAKRDVWQRVWASSRLPPSEACAIAGLRVTGLQGDTIYVSTWRLEEGCVPNDWDLEEDVLRPLPEAPTTTELSP